MAIKLAVDGISNGVDDPMYIKIATMVHVITGSIPTEAEVISEDLRLLKLN